MHQMVFPLRINMDAYYLQMCLACGSGHLDTVLNLRDQPLANNFLSSPSDKEPKYPLAVNLCKNCCHLQLTYAVDPAVIYRHYLYVSGTSQTQRVYMQWFAKFACEFFHEKPKTVLDIGCNDGTQLDYFGELGIKTFGIDPAENLYADSSKKHTIMCDFFNLDTARKFRSQHGTVDCVVAQNSFAHVPDPVGYLEALREVINPDGLFLIQTSQADMVINNEFDTIYHEHVNFYNINSMRELCRRTGFNLVDVQKTPIHGTSYVFVLSVNKQAPERVNNLIEFERQKGLLDTTTYHNWAETVRKNVATVDSYGFLFRNKGFKMIGYGAAAKGNTLLNFSHLPLDMIIDDNPLKQGTYSPGRHIPVVGIDVLDRIPSTQPILFVPLAWNFYREIRNRILAKRQQEHDRFMRYFPEVTIE